MYLLIPIHTFGIFIYHMHWPLILLTQGMIGAKVHKREDISYKLEDKEVELGHDWHYLVLFLPKHIYRRFGLNIFLPLRIIALSCNKILMSAKEICLASKKQRMRKVEIQLTSNMFTLKHCSFRTI